MWLPRVSTSGGQSAGYVDVAEERVYNEAGDWGDEEAVEAVDEGGAESLADSALARAIQSRTDMQERHL